MRPAQLAWALSLVLLLGTRRDARAADAPADSLGPAAVADEAGGTADDGVLPAGAPGTPVATSAARRDGLVALVPGLAEHAYAIAPGPRPYAHRLVVTPAFGELGSDALFVLRLAYAPSTWFAYEAELGHAPNRTVSAILHRFNVVLRRPLPGRVQPFVEGGYGMAVVLPGRSVNADAVTRNMLAAGGGLEFYVRDDLALRADLRRCTVFGSQANRTGVVVYEYAEQTLGLEFHRFLQP